MEEMSSLNMYDDQFNILKSLVDVLNPIKDEKVLSSFVAKLDKIF